MTKRIVPFIALISLLFSACLKDLEREGIYNEMTCRGTVVEQSLQQPVEGIHVRLVHDGRAIATTLTDGDGRFELPLKCDELNKGVNIEVFADSLYEGTSVALAPQGYGRQYYDVGTLYVVGPGLPCVTTGDISDITATTAQCFGEVTASGKSNVVQRGLCWSTLQYPTLSNAYAVSGSGLGTFDVTMENLSVGTTYYVRAFATNGVGTAYGEQRMFTTLGGLPTVTTAAVTSVTATAATCGGEVTGDGDFAVTARGVCWSTAPDPTVANAHTNDGNGTGTFVSNLTGLAPGTAYYVRAYATNQNGSSYGEQRTFATPSGLPSVTTAEVSSVTATSAICGGDVTSDGGFNVTARGVCYSTTPNPTIASPHTTDGSGTGTYVSQMINLTSGTTYYVRAYATNATGTVYGVERSFTTNN